MKNTIPHAPTTSFLSFDQIRNHPGVYVPVEHPNERLICIEGEDINELPALLWVSPSRVQVALESVWKDKEFVDLRETFNITVNRS